LSGANAVHTLRSLVFAYAVLAVSAAFAAAPSPAARAEIDHLFAYLGKSGCEFFRNGDWHSAANARTHLERKFSALLERGQIATAEDFIKLAASESSASGKPYLVRCAARAASSSAQWLTEELERYRQARGKK
jgi:hypothetical protein